MSDSLKYLVPATNIAILMKQLTVRGFQVFLCQDEWPQAFTEMNRLIQEVSICLIYFAKFYFQIRKFKKCYFRFYQGQLKTKEHVYVGFEKMREAFFDLFKGTGFGKYVVKTQNEITHYGNL